MSRATVSLTYLWPEGAALSVELTANVTTPAALTDLRIEARRALRDALLELDPAVEVTDGEATAPNP